MPATGFLSHHAHEYISGFEHFPDYSTCCIFSPFSEKGQIEELINITKDLDNSTVSDIIRNKLSEYYSLSDASY